MPINKTNNLSSFYIATIGASAGGVEAIQKLLLHLPDETGNMALVIVQHLSPSYKSMLADALKKYTKLNIAQARNGITITGNNIYVTPSGCEIVIRNGKIFLSKTSRTGAARPSIDNLFISLAKDQGARAIGIVLSGTGTDGASGIMAIKDAGGITMAQDPNSARYEGMPLAAIETGKVDYVLSPEKIGAKLNLLIKKTGLTLIKISKDQKRKGFEGVIELLSKNTGIDFINYKHNTLFRRITRRMDQLKLDTADQYLQYLKKNHPETDELFYSTLIGFTGFFRDPPVFKALQKKMLAIIEAKQPHDPIRIWIAGCATGEEVYSVAISLAMLQKGKKVQHPVQIIATDINEHALNIARKGIYAKKILQNLPAEIIKNYFTNQNGNYEINKNIRSMVLFSRHDLANNPPFLKMDLVVCRNLLIYFNSKMQNHVFPVFHSALQSNGYLLLGKSESIGSFSNLFSVVSNAAKIYQRKAASFVPRTHYTPIKPIEKLTAELPAERSIDEMARETIFRIFEWPYVIVNDSMEVQEIHGDVGKYLSLSPGQMNANLVKLAHKALKIELRLLVNKCVAGKKETLGLVKKIEISGKDHFVKIRIQPVAFSQQPNDLYLVIFENVKTGQTSVEHTFIPSGKNDARRILVLEKELETVKLDLQNYIDRLENTHADLQSINEELQSANEELKISNEELETTNEELQSANEEINIAYSELKTANDALEIHDAALKKSETNVQALLSNTLQAFILLDTGYQVITFNKVAKTTFKNIFGKSIEPGINLKQLVPKDIFAHFGPEMEEALKGKTIIKEKAIRAVNDKQFEFIVNYTPVVTGDNKTEALSLSLLDITDINKTRAELIKSRQLINSVFHSADIGIAVIDEKGKYIKTNEGYNKLFGYKTNELEGKSYTLTVSPQKRKDALKKIAEYAGGEKGDEESIAVKKNGECITVYRTANELKNDDGKKYFVITLRDITETKKYQQLLMTTAKIAKIGGWEMDVPTGKLVRTEELSEILGVSENELKKYSFEKRVAMFFDAPAANQFRKVMSDAIKTGEAFDLELPLKTGNQKMKWIHITCVPEIAGSKVIKMKGITQDITFKKEAELQLERLSLVASITSNAVFITDRYGKTEWINDAVTRMTGYTLDEIKDKSPGEILQGKDTDKNAISRISKMLKKHLPVSEVIKNYRKDGTAFWINMDIAPVLKEKELVNFVGIGVDVTELIEAKETVKANYVLEQQKKIFDAIASNFPDGMIGVLDKNFQYNFVGGTEINKLGLTREDFIGNKIFDHISESNNAIALPYLQKVLTGERMSFEIEMKGNFYSVNAVPLISENERVSQILIVIYNITINKKAEADLRETLNKEKELGNLKSRFVSMASHEFRTPLSTVLSSAYLIDKYKTTDDQPLREKHLARIVSSVETLTEILNDFLSLGKIEEGKVRLRPVQLNLPETIKTLIREIKNKLKKDQLIEYKHKGGLELMLDPTLLKHIFMNLVSNASKFSPEAGTIELETKCLDGCLTFSVKDHGIGISIADQKHLAELFFRGSNATHIQGTGLGLHIVSRYVELMNGTIECKSELEKGTAFIITLKSNS